MIANPRLIAAFACGILVACGIPAGAELVQEHILTRSTDGPLELIVTNTSTGPFAMTEVRAVNDAACAMDLGTVGSNYAAPGDTTIAKNTAFLVSESTCNGMLIKSNGGPVELAAHETGNIQIRPHRNCPDPAASGFCVDTTGSLWFVGKGGTATHLAGP